MVIWREENGHNARPWRQGTEMEEGRDATQTPESSNCELCYGQERTIQKGEVGTMADWRASALQSKGNCCGGAGVSMRRASFRLF